MSKNLNIIVISILIFTVLIFIFPDFFSKDPKYMSINTFLFISFFMLILLIKIVIFLYKKITIQEDEFIGTDFHDYSRSAIEPSEKKLRKLLWMSKSQLRKELIPDTRNTQADIKHAIELSEKIQSYCSLNVSIDSSNKELQDHDFVTIYRRMDFVAPDKFHVSQDAWDSDLGEVRYEWISLGDKNFQNTGPWSSTEDGYSAEVNEELKMDKYIEIMCNNEPINQEVLILNENQYLRLEYKVPLTGKFSTAFIKNPVFFTCQIYLWIDLDSGFFVKGETIFKERSNTVQDILNVIISHHKIIAKYIDVYACNNENIKIETPKLNSSLNEKAEATIINTDIITVPHHK